MENNSNLGIVASPLDGQHKIYRMKILLKATIVVKVLIESQLRIHLRTHTNEKQFY